ncbi:MAG: hypothetical protein OHK0046_52320 [Anaerolineae bacterium]
MAVELSWFLTERILYFRYTGIVTVDDIHRATEQAVMMGNQVSTGTVHALHNATDLHALPINLKLLTSISTRGFRHPRSGWSVAHGLDNRVIRYVGSAVAELARARYKLVAEEADALRFLQQVDPALPDLFALTGKRLHV